MAVIVGIVKSYLQAGNTVQCYMFAVCLLIWDYVTCFQRLRFVF